MLNQQTSSDTSIPEEELVVPTKVLGTFERWYSLVLFMQLIFACGFSSFAHAQENRYPPDTSSEVNWPSVTQTAKPWTRWWWHGSAVDEENLTRLLEEYQSVGLGGVEVTCIYGVQGNDARNRNYLSPSWVEAVQHTIREASRLGMGVDLPAGSGWRMGGPSVRLEDANTILVLEKLQVAGGENIAKKFEKFNPQALLAIADNGERVTVTNPDLEGPLRWEAPKGSNWTAYCLGHTWAGDRVKRPSPGGEGLNINPFYRRSVESYLAHFGKKLDQLPGVRAQFHDSFEYEGNWQPDFLREFAEKRGYRLEDHLTALAGDDSEATVARVKCDYRETLSDLVLENLTQPWVAWSHKHNSLARNQAHGSPANWLDVYGACDVPETESFGRLQGGDADQLIMKFASSAANVAGRKLVSAETGTWLEEHFHVTLAALKQIVDRQFLAGVNHTFYHGTAYSPEDARWPGWLFYASSQLNPQNPIWRDLPTLNSYITRCQSILQASQPDNDVLLYWPIYDSWNNPSGLRVEFRVHNAKDWFYGQPLGNAAKTLQENGYAFDYVSDRGLSFCQTDDNGVIASPGGSYDVIVIPKAQHIPLATLTKLSALASFGAKIVYWGGLPKSEPGMNGATESEEWHSALSEATERSASGTVSVSDDLVAALGNANVRREKRLCESGIDFLRKQWHGDTIYFLHNNSDQPIDTWSSLSGSCKNAILLSPSSGRIGKPATRFEQQEEEIRLQIAPSETIFLRVCASETNMKHWPYTERSGTSIELLGPWRVSFISGGPKIPASFETLKPVSWTQAPDKNAERFAGAVRYRTTFSVDRVEPTLLDLGEVLGSARIILNGETVATLIASPYQVVLEKLQEDNELEIEVTGLAANRIRDLDRNKVKWRVFDDINFVNISYRRFDASKWRVRDMGLLGPVTLTPVILSK